MPSYDTTRYDPPAPIARVNLQRSDGGGGGALVRDVVLLIDTGAHISLLPRSAVDRTGAPLLVGTQYEVIGVDGISRTMADAVDLDMQFLNKSFRGRYLLTDSDHGILGRGVLNGLRVLFDGPQQEWSSA